MRCKSEIVGLEFVELNVSFLSEIECNLTELKDPGRPFRASKEPIRPYNFLNIQSFLVGIGVLNRDFENRCGVLQMQRLATNSFVLGGAFGKCVYLFKLLSTLFTATFARQLVSLWFTNCQHRRLLNGLFFRRSRRRPRRVEDDFASGDRPNETRI